MFLRKWKSMTDKHNDGDKRGYQEFKYPYQHPVSSPIDMVKELDLTGLTPLEAAFTRWQALLNDGEEAMRRLIHPAYAFDLSLQNHVELVGRPLLKDFLSKVRAKNPNLTYYTHDRLIGILDEEVKYLDVDSRNKRFNEELVITKFDGKKSLHEEELAEIELRLKCVDMIHRIISSIPLAIAGIDESSPAGSGRQGVGPARLFGEAEKLIGGIRERREGVD